MVGSTESEIVGGIRFSKMLGQGREDDGRSR